MAASKRIEPWHRRSIWAREDPQAATGDKSPTISKELSGCAAAKADEPRDRNAEMASRGREGTPNPPVSNGTSTTKEKNRRRLPAALAEKYLRR